MALPGPSIWTVAIGLATLAIVAAGFYLAHIRTPRSKIRIQQLTDDDSEVTHQEDWVLLESYATAVNDGKRDGRLRNPVFQKTVFYREDEARSVTPEEIGAGSIQVVFLLKNEKKVEGLSTDTLRIDHRFPRGRGIQELISEYDRMRVWYDVPVEDGTTPYEIEARTTIDISEITLP